MTTPPQTFLAIDVGNIRTKIGLFDLKSPQQHSLQETAQSNAFPQLIQSAAFAVDSEIDWAALALWWEQRTPLVGAIIAGANPVGVKKIEASWNQFTNLPLIELTDRKLLQIKIDVASPEKVGIDRLLNAVAIKTLLKEKQQPSIIVDTGTATTVDLIEPDGTFSGGAILPGFELCARSLNRYTALLPLIDMKSLIKNVPDIVGKETHAAVCSGLYWGQIGAIKEVVRQMEKEFFARTPSHSDRSNSETSTKPQKICLVITGGASPLLQPHFPQGTLFQSHLGLLGLAALGIQTFASPHVEVD